MENHQCIEETVFKTKPMNSLRGNATIRYIARTTVFYGTGPTALFISTGMNLRTGWNLL